MPGDGACASWRGATTATRASSRAIVQPAPAHQRARRRDDLRCPGQSARRGRRAPHGHARVDGGGQFALGIIKRPSEYCAKPSHKRADTKAWLSSRAWPSLQHGLRQLYDVGAIAGHMVKRGVV